MMAWVDLETTGLDVDRDVILEVGLAITLDDLTLLAKYSFVVYRPVIFRSSLDKVVLDMHTKNGLLDLCSTGTDLSEIEEALCAVMERTFHGGSIASSPLCGSSVHFDRAFMKKYMPKFEECFHYRNIDTSTIKELVERWPERARTNHKAVRPVPKKLHRVDPDLTDSIDEMRYYRELLFV